MKDNGTFVDTETADNGYWNVRHTTTGLGLTLSLESDGDIEVFLDDATRQSIAAALTHDSAPEVAESRHRQSVWIFHGEHARFASGVFTTRSNALAWAAKHAVSGLLTQYPVGDGCYDIATELGKFTASKPHHGKPEHVAGFSPGWTQHLHIIDGMEA
jgi:hypothetical protein